MKQPTIKKRNKRENFYAELQEKTVKRISELSGAVWTDHNEHDPGITIGDYSNFGLFDLYFRQQFSFEEYLFQGNEQVDYAKKGMFNRSQLYTRINSFNQEVPRKSIVTESDYEEFFMEHFSQDLLSCSVRLNGKTKKYDLFLFLKNEEFPDSTCLEVANHLKVAIKQLFHKQRNLGEDIGVMYFNRQTLLDKKNYKARKGYRKYNYDFPTFRDVSNLDAMKRFSPAYTTIQYDFPENYGISERGIPVHDDPNYRLKVLQLKGYLLLFDYMISNQLNHIGSVSQLFDMNRELPVTCLPTVDLVDVESLIDESRKEEMTDEVKEERFYETQRFRYVNLLDTLYNEDSRHMFGTVDVEKLNDNRMQVLKKLPFLNERRFQSFDIFQPNSMSTIQELTEEIISIRFSEQLLLKNNVVKVVSDEVFIERFPGLLSSFTNMVSVAVPEGTYLLRESDEELIAHMKEVLTLVWYGVIPVSIIEYGADLDNYTILNIEGEFCLIFNAPDSDLSLTISLLHANQVLLLEELYSFVYFIKKLKRFGYQQHLYFIEHILMNDMDNANLITVVYPKNSSDRSLEKWLNEWLEERLPAHLNFKLCGLSNGVLETFHLFYYDWRKALAEENREQITEKSEDLQFFFKYAQENKAYHS